MDLSIIIVNYKSKGFTLNCIKSIKESDLSNIRHEIIVVDNGSQDAIGEILRWQYPEVSFIQNEINLGMGAGNNVGIRRAKGDYILVMNPDTIAFKDTFQILYKYLEQHKDVGIVGPQQLNPDSTIQDSCYRWYGFFTPAYRRTPLGKLKFAQKDINRFLMRDFDHQAEREVDWLLGSFLMMRAEALKKINGFDERYFLYFEDTDLCRSIWKHNLKVVYLPAAKVIHNHSRHSAQAAWWKFIFNAMARHHIISWLKYLWKWRGSKSNFIKNKN